MRWTGVWAMALSAALLTPDAAGAQAQAIDAADRSAAPGPPAGPDAPGAPAVPKPGAPGRSGAAAGPRPLAERVGELEARNAALETVNHALVTRLAALEAALVTLARRLDDETALRDAADARLDAKIDPIARYITVELDEIDGLPGPHLIITGANVHLRSGTGLTDDGGEPVGLGNLVLGYNEPGGEGLLPGDRSGSHNVVIGTGRRFFGSGGLLADQPESGEAGEAPEAGEVPADGAPADGAPADGAPAEDVPADGAPADGAAPN
jgi:hypothetical protein